MNESVKTVLIIEDEEHQRAALRAGFEREKCHVITATNGKEGLEKLKETLPNVILLDLMMPVLDGFAFLDALKSDEGFKHIPVVILTNLGTQERLTNSINNKCDYFFTKTNSSLKEIIAKTREICLNANC